MGQGFTTTRIHDSLEYDKEKCTDNKLIKNYINELNYRYKLQFLKIVKLEEKIKNKKLKKITNGDINNIKKIIKLKSDLASIMMNDNYYDTMIKYYHKCHELKDSEYYSEYKLFINNTLFILFQNDYIREKYKKNTTMKNTKEKMKRFKINIIKFAEILNINITSVKERSYKQMKELNKHIIEYNEQLKNKEM
jgi:hypothetical protein